MTDPTASAYLDELRTSRRAFTVVVPGEPIGWPRQSVRIMGPASGPKKFYNAQLYVPTHTGRGAKRKPTRHHAWKDRAVALLTSAWGEAENIMGGAPMTGPVIVDALCIFPRPKRLPDRVRHLQKHPGRILRDAKPDDDNVAKAIRDSMTEAGIWDDDVQATGLTVRCWGGPEEAPHTFLRVYPVDYDADALVSRVFGPMAWQEDAPL